MGNRNASRGAYFKARTRKWLAEQGYQVAEMEIVRFVFTPKGRLPIKRDQFGSDLVAMSAERIIFVQVKGGQQAIGAGKFPDARRKFQEFTFPPGVLRWVVAWAPRVSQPRIVDMSSVETKAVNLEIPF